MEIGLFLNVNTLPAKEWLKDTYNVKGETLYETIQNNPGNKGLKLQKGKYKIYI